MFPAVTAVAVFLLTLGVAGDAAGRALVAFKRQNRRSLHSRAWKREIVPKDVITLEYGMEAAPYPSTSLKFTAHANTPIVMLEDIDAFLDSISCHTGLRSSGNAEVELNFRGNDMYGDALATWSAYPAFILVTAHLSCNLDNSRGAWHITGVHGHANYPQITLTAQSIPLGEMGKSYHVSHSSVAGSAWGPRTTLNKRLDTTFNLGHTLDFAQRQQLFPVDSTLLSTRSDDSDRGTDVSFADDIRVTCVDCVSRANFSVGLEFEVADGTSIQTAHINITVLDFQHDIQLEFAFNETLSISKSIDVIRAPLPDLGLSIKDIATIGFFYGGTVGASLEIVGGLNFTVGAKASIPSGAVASYVMAGNGNSSVTGWNASSFDLIPFRLNGGSLNATAELSLSPFLDIEFDLLSEFTNQARVSMDTPKLVASASILTDVNRQCKPVGPQDFEFFTAALTFGAAANLNIQATANSSIPGLDSADVSLFTHSAGFGDFPTPDAPACFIVVDDTGDNGVITSGSASAALATLTAAPTGTLLSAASAVPSFDIRKIESYYSSVGALPTNVNYTQLAQATQIPSDLKNAVTGLLHGSAASVDVPNKLLVLLVLIAATLFL